VVLVDIAVVEVGDGIVHVLVQYFRACTKLMKDV